jgi:hypothetical protein
MSDLESGDLVCRSRRERLSDADEQRLSRLLRASKEARFHAEVLREVEQGSSMQAGDDALVARMTARALGPVRPPARRKLAISVMQAALAMLLLGATSTALGWSRVLKSFLAGPHSSGVTIRVATDAPAQRSGARPHTAPQADGNPAGASPSVTEATPEPEPEAPSVVSTAPSPAALLARANLARREGRATDAQKLYRSIVTAHPGAREAPLAHLALGKLLEGSQPNAALSHYGALAAAGGALRAEGLWGQAVCARRLERKPAEKQALEALVREFPASPYADAARGRMRDASR